MRFACLMLCLCGVVINLCLGARVGWFFVSLLLFGGVSFGVCACIGVVCLRFDVFVFLSVRVWVLLVIGSCCV